ncbi:hypothetical protein BD626DRAFT_541576 [Schizophyllum amplum]|uniref:Chitin-binding type-4 domain-containing protein n=1 Tax=Schizophyllum amplum TaxID=97359 RepID=A0A550BUA9_9AGAR|nr:hypothetical protein BD626DRAFT_541576 [Auriculariopsis ampla]
MRSLIVVAALAAIARAHVGSFVKGMYCRNGGADYDEPNSNNEVKPIYDQNLENFMFNQAQNCLNDPPPEGEIADLPAGGVIDIELATNRGCTTFSFGGQYATKYIDGSTVDYPMTGMTLTVSRTPTCTRRTNDIHDVTFDNLVVFSVLPKYTSFHPRRARLGSTVRVQYEIPADMPPVPERRLHLRRTLLDLLFTPNMLTYRAQWLWVPNGCGTPNEYMDGFKCRVTNATGTKQLGAPQPPVYCGEDAAPYETSVPAPEAMVVWGQDPSINNVVVPANSGVSPGYNERSGFEPGAQNDIFTGGDITW